uniref:Putative vacuolar h+ atpase n=1 Tax=Ornithodoros turicata TaxID=34597 RepID=A0A2R5LC77_9ACAR
MGADAAPVAILTTFWFIVGGILPWFVPKGNNRGLVQSMLITTAVLCYVFWLCTYLMQMHPFFGPLLENSTLIAANEYWPSK